MDLFRHIIRYNLLVIYRGSGFNIYIHLFLTHLSEELLVTRPLVGDMGFGEPDWEVGVCVFAMLSDYRFAEKIGNQARQ